jgi:hypothetical protein
VGRRVETIWTASNTSEIPRYPPLLPTLPTSPKTGQIGSYMQAGRAPSTTSRPWRGSRSPLNGRSGVDDRTVEADSKRRLLSHQIKAGIPSREGELGVRD